LTFILEPLLNGGGPASGAL